MADIKDDTPLQNGNAPSEVPRNHGSSDNAPIADGQQGQTQPDWLLENGVDKDKRVRLVKVSHMRYQHPDLENLTTFLQDFGMHLVKSTETQRWFGGYGPDQYVYLAQKGAKKFLGGTFEVESYEELEKITKLSDITVTSNGIQKLTDAPGGGSLLSIEDPAGYPLNFLWGQTMKESVGDHSEKLIINHEGRDKPRVGKFQRFSTGAAAVFKLGHFGYVVDNLPAQMAFYTKNFNIVPSDVLYVPGTNNNIPGAMFAHIDRGSEYVDHHSIFMVGKPPDADFPSHIHHSSYEVHDFDTQQLGHQWLKKKGYDLAWGIGRHVMGSQIFDYWWDPTGFMVEHYADGDQVNEDTPVAFGDAGVEGLSVWGPEVTQGFLTGVHTPSVEVK